MIFSKKTQVFQGDYHVRLKPNASNNLTDVYLFNDPAGSEVFFKTIPNVYRDHYHVAEFSNGNLYIIERTGDANDMKSQNWTDELWKFGSKDNGTKLYSAKGIDFRVSLETGEIAIFSQSDTKKVLDTSIVIMDLSGKVLKMFAGSSLSGMDNSKALTPLFWQNDIFWFTASQGSQITDTYTFDSKDQTITKRSK